MAFQPVHQKRQKPSASKGQTSRRAYLNGMLCLSTDCSKRRRGNGTVSRAYSMRITLPQWLMERADLLPGTRVEFEKDPDGRRCLIRPCEDGRWTISKNAEVEEKGYLRISLEPGMPTVVKTEVCYKPKLRAAGGVEFIVPDSASFDRNLRADALTQTQIPGLESA